MLSMQLGPERPVSGTLDGDASCLHNIFKPFSEGLASLRPSRGSPTNYRIIVKQSVAPVLAGETRRRIMAFLEAGPACPGDLARALGLSQSHVSNQLALLKSHHLVGSSQAGRRVYYAVAPQQIANTAG
ncbi:ArsR/SmtB family transcription factor [Paenarthrobacter sp. NPDC089675]|uniref:ArsR/SmtB family transcription factor n=1 Tax=Paenarthrobacter sp. NPDC089675 TaxID=3364376 RepID=UPI00380267DB